MGPYLVPTTALSLLCAPGLHTFGQTYGQNIQRVKLSTILLKHFYRALVYPVTDYRLVLIRIYIYYAVRNVHSDSNLQTGFDDRQGM